MTLRSRVGQVGLPVLVIVLFWLAALAASGISQIHVLSTSVDGLTLANYRQDPLQVQGIAPLSPNIYADAYRDALNGPHGVSWVWFSAATPPPVALARGSSTATPSATVSPSPLPRPSSSPTTTPTPTPTPTSTPTPTPAPTPTPTPASTPTPTPIVDAPLTITQIGGSASQGAGVTFTDADPNGNLSQYTGTISWGDGTTTGGTFATNPSGGFAFGGTHAYRAPGAYKVIVTIRDVGGASATASTTIFAN